MAFKFSQRRVTDPMAQQNFEQLEGELDQVGVASCAFRATLAGNQSLGVASPGYVTYAEVDYNIGDAYGVNPIWGRWGFTAPVDGVYWFGWGIVTNPLSVGLQPELRINAVPHSYAGARDGFNYSGATWAFGYDQHKMTKGQFAEMALNWQNGGGAVTVFDNNSYSFFTGHLVGRL